MAENKSDIISRLRREILPLQGICPSTGYRSRPIDMGIINPSFADQHFPTAAIHEYISTTKEEAACAAGFVSAILSALLHTGGVAIWISASRTIFPPALQSFGIEPDHIIFVDVPHQKELLWVMEEALQCDSLCAVIAEIRELDFTASRRLQLAVEKSRVTGFILRNNPRSINITACVSRWKITPLPSLLENNIPGVGFPRWHVALLKIRNGKPGSWPMEWVDGRFRYILQETPTRLALPQKKAV